MNRQCKDLLRKVPFFSWCVRRVRRLPCFSGTTRQIRGARNRIDCDPTATLTNVRFEIHGDGNEIRIGRHCVMRNVLVSVTGNGHRIEIGDGVCFNREATLWLQDDTGSLVVGAGTTFETVSLGVTENGSRIEIGADCMFASDIDVRTGDSHSVLEAGTRRRLNHARSVTIGDHVWIGAHCIILKGVSIAPDCILAAGSVLTKSIEEPGTIAGGNPAKPIKTGITWDRSRAL